MLETYLKTNPKVREILKSDNLRISNTNIGFNESVIAVDYLVNKKTIFVVLPNLNKAQKYYDALINILPSEKVLFYPNDELITSEMLISSLEFKMERINTIGHLLDGEYVVVTNVAGLLKKQMSKEKWINSKIHLEEGIEILNISQKLLDLGYKKTYTIERVGEYSVRGNIIDIFPLNQENPCRIELFGDEIDEIKEFNINTQISIKKIKSVDISPLNELFMNQSEYEHLKIFLNSNINEEMACKDLERLEKRDQFDVLTKYISLFSNSTITDFKSDKRIYFINEEEILSSYEKILEDIHDFTRLNGMFYESLNHIKDITEINPNIIISELNGKNINAYNTTLHLGDYKGFIEELKKYKNEKIIFITFSSMDRLTAIKEYLIDNDLFPMYIKSINYSLERGIYLVMDNIESFILDDMMVINEKSIYKPKEVRKIKYKSVFGESTRIKSVDELKINDYIVHYDYGIGKYIGIETIELSGIKRDYIHLEYRDNGSLYIPLEQINLIAKYNKSEGFAPRLSKLGTSEWAKTKARVKKSVSDISDKLIQLYALRNEAIGFKFSEDDKIQYEFESDFEYEETIDQLKAIEDVKRDMESTKPMDRLICGDVGYGKTEIAMRAAMKAILDNKQVAYLAPTTVLTSQHYKTFKARFDKYGANIALLNRFVTGKKLKSVLSDIKEGKIDIVIGTHRLLSKDVVFKDLGLLIVDEEQRFGVMHKERIKEMRVNVDSITLTATPIPRTLQMSIMGIKDISILDTPPKNRYPVQTYVLEREDRLIKEAIERELSRNGQVFYLYNSISDIELMASKIQNLVPDARVCFAHGRMDKNDLEDIINSFVNHEFDILVSTTIIETGIDIPNSNTLLVHDATKLGLAQLYQLRGRVGRSDRIAYAYLMYDKNKILSEESTKRLEAIKEFTELGSGYKIAKIDLSIRGSGDILGADQSGFIDSVGYDVYMHILEETIKEKQGIKEEINNDSKAFVNRHIDKNYISDDGVRIEIHKKINNIKTHEELKNLSNELVDRFGKFDDELKMYMYEKLFRNLAKRICLLDLTEDNDKVVLELKDELDGKKLFKHMIPHSAYMTIALRHHKIYLTIDKHKMPKHWIYIMCDFLEKY